MEPFRKRSDLHRERGREDHDGTEEMAYLNFFVLAVLILVEVDGRYRYRREPKGLDEGSDGHGPTAGANADGLLPENARESSRERPRLRIVHLRPVRARCLAARTIELRNLRMAGAGLIVGIGLDDVVALILDVGPNLGEERVALGFLHQPHVEGGGRAVRDDGARLGAHVGALEPTNVERGILKRLLKTLADEIGLRNPKELQKRRLVVGDGLQDSPILGRESNPVVEARDENAAAIVFHRGEKLREAHPRIRNPVPIVAAMEGELRTVHGEIHREVPARAIDKRRTVRRMNP